MNSEWEYQCPVCTTRLRTLAELPVVVKCPHCKSLLRVQTDRVVVIQRRPIPLPPGTRTAAGAIGGLLLGGAVGGPVGAFLGLLFGGFLGAAAEAEEAKE